MWYAMMVIKCADEQPLSEYHVVFLTLPFRIEVGSQEREF
jgi:hypothetical protein